MGITRIDSYMNEHDIQLMVNDVIFFMPTENNINIHILIHEHTKQKDIKRIFNVIQNTPSLSPIMQQENSDKLRWVIELDAYLRYDNLLSLLRGFPDFFNETSGKFKLFITGYNAKSLVNNYNKHTNEPEYETLPELILIENTDN